MEFTLHKLKYFKQSGKSKDLPDLFFIYDERNKNRGFTASVYTIQHP